ncbi:MAG TPA: hypothetical protein VGI19_17450 [Candidatus Cybelea sp.]|jgi:hypothetical protein
MTDFNDGDWVEGAAKWWWKYVLPNPASFWQAVLANISVERVSQGLQQVTGGVLEGVAMLHAAARADEASARRLNAEAIEKINQALGGARRA